MNAPNGPAKRTTATTTTTTATPRHRPWPAQALAALGIVLLMGATGWVASAGPEGGGASQPPPRLTEFHAAMTSATTLAPSSTGLNGSWAWGAVANLSISEQYVGAYNASMALSGTNLTTAGAYVAVSEAAAIQFATYESVTSSYPTNTTRYVTLESVELRDMALALQASGTFPVAGVYNATTPVRLVPMNISLAASIAQVSVVLAYLNFTTGSNGSLSLVNEHVETLRAINISLAASNFPNVTVSGLGQSLLTYTTGAVSASGYIVEDVNATFTPALLVVDGPLYVGKTWAANSTASFVGGAAYAITYSATSGGATSSWSQAGAVSANATIPLSVVFTVVGTQTVYLPDGSSETDYEIVASNGTGNHGILIANGMAVLPSSDPTHAAGIPQTVRAHPVAAAAASPSVPAAATLYSNHRQLPDASVSVALGTSTVTATPISTPAAQAHMQALRAPVREAARPASSPVGSPFGGLILVAGLVVVAVGSVLVLREVRRLH